MQTKLHSRRGGFTLVEIMIVVAIIALLAAIAVPSFLRARKRSQATVTLETLRAIDGAKDQYAFENSKGPTVTPAPADLAPYVKSRLEALHHADRWHRPVRCARRHDRGQHDRHAAAGQRHDQSRAG